jgi:catechol 2,3-dioxygenase
MAADSDRLPDSTHIGSVLLRGTDPERLRAFYEDTIGTPARLMRFEHAGQMAPRRSTGLFHTAIRFPTREALASALRRAMHSTAHMGGASDHGVSEALYMSDMEGNGVELYWDRPREAWPREPDGRISMYTIPLDVPALLTLPEVEPDPSSVDIGHVHLKVSDIAGSLPFYRDLLGMDEQVSWGEAAFLSAGGYHHHVGMNVWESRGAPPLPEGSAGLGEVEIAVPDTAAVDAVAQRLESAGIDTRRDDGRLLFRDPDRIPLAVAPA